jgi:hypothetical protein
MMAYNTHPPAKKQSMARIEARYYSNFPNSLTDYHHCLLTTHFGFGGARQRCVRRF